ncbi:uncharacterized protein B0H18DRAFT_1080996 [Fomitopsis serialis]|uniref:uncharacterized protein n=1 Tax=Fomitopsis serialis TaxID=139415 RepID=UPI002008A1F1|nr:uncharacterized protein B0H18DRAFT_1080996 [Neoantrodia serialis]KAH9938235.1 hypothetical protein B0H18DRAFT_1080996 [Neoantrodia serialis]
MHQAFKIGSFWSKIPGYEARGSCPVCGEVESISHILLTCQAIGRELVWSLARSLWERKGLPWSVPSLADILGIGTKVWTVPGRRKRREGASRFWRVLISESVYFIWKLRCERVIAHADEEGWQHSVDSVRSRWLCAMNLRLHTDMDMTHRRFGRKALKAQSVLATWNGVIHDERALPYEWNELPKVLVGILLRVPLDAG